jgi:hypothetical protein
VRGGAKQQGVVENVVNVGNTGGLPIVVAAGVERPNNIRSDAPAHSCQYSRSVHSIIPFIFSSGPQEGYTRENYDSYCYYSIPSPLCGHRRGRGEGEKWKR